MDEEAIKKMLEEIPGSIRAADGIIIPAGDDGSFHVTGIFNKDELEGLTDEEHFFWAFCSKQEIIRLRSLRNAHDYLLRLRAMAIVDEPRAVRVMRRRRKEFTSKGAKWSLTSYYVSSQMEFTYGHEYSHYLLGHLNNSNLNLRSMYDATDKSVLGDFVIHDHELEFRADLKAVQLVERDSNASLKLAWGAFSVFVLLHFLIEAERNLGLRKFSVSSTHPSPTQRVWRLQQRLGRKSPYSDQSLKDSLQSANDLLEIFNRHVLDQQMNFRPDILSFYGSIYLPSFKGQILRDRIDF